MKVATALRIADSFVILILGQEVIFYVDFKTDDFHL